VKLPSSDAGKVAAILLDAINNADRDKLAQFIKASFTASALQQTPAAEYLETFLKLGAQSKGLDVFRIEQPGPRMLVLDVRSRRGSRPARLVVVMSRKEPTKLSEVMTLSLPRSDADGQKPLPETKLSEDDVVKEIGRRVDRLAADDDFSGVVLIAKGDRIILHRAWGMAEKGFEVANRPDTKFHLGSMDKMFTSVAIAQLVAAGRLSFEDKLASVLPDYPNKEAAAKITIHHLLTHSAGLGDIFKPAFHEHREKYVNPRDFFPLFVNEPLLFEPGARFGYSNAGFIVLGAVIEQVSGTSYFDYVRKAVFEPCAMSDTAPYELNAVVPNRAVGYLRDAREDPLGIEPRRSNVMFLGFKGGPAGGSYSTAPDLLRFAQALRGGKLLQKSQVERITSGKVGFGGPFGPEQYGYGFETLQAGGKEVRGHGGGGPNSGVDSELRIFWDGSYTVIVLGNYDAPAATRLTHELCTFLARQ
jgi:CubicO group peptidase (beta-lactamase class C family)